LVCPPIWLPAVFAQQLEPLKTPPLHNRDILRVTTIP
jgi:hypothetical protein